MSTTSRKKRIPKLSYSEIRGTRYFASYGDPKTDQPKKYRFGRIPRDKARDKAVDAYQEWLAAHIVGETSSSARTINHKRNQSHTKSQDLNPRYIAATLYMSVKRRRPLAVLLFSRGHDVRSIRLINICLICFIFAYAKALAADPPREVDGPSNAPLSSVQTTDRPSEDYWSKAGAAATGALVGAVATFLANSILAYRKEQREPRKKLSYSTVIRRVSPSIDKSVSDGVKIAYKGHQVQELGDVSFDVINTGNSLVRDHFVRLEFPKTIQILESRIDPPVAPELGVAKDEQMPCGPNEVRFKISHLDKDARVGFRFIVGGTGNPMPDVHPYNETETVDWERLVTTQSRSELDKTRMFVLFGILYFLLPALFGIIPGALPLSDVPSSLVRFIIVLMMLPFVKSASQTFVEMIQALLLLAEKARQDQPGIHLAGDLRNMSLIVASDGSNAAIRHGSAKGDDNLAKPALQHVPQQ